jgi:hypothetical protein
MEGIESQARDDFTIAPVGSHLSFNAAARIVSTPFNPNFSGKLPLADMSCIEPAGSDIAGPGGSSVPADQQENQHGHNPCPESFDDTTKTPYRKGLR